MREAYAGERQHEPEGRKFAYAAMAIYISMFAALRFVVLPGHMGAWLNAGFFMTTWCYLVAAYRDPGRLPSGATAELAGFDGPRCGQCDGPKPERAHHCSECDVCVLKMEHHCTWLGQCIGLRTHKAFVLLTLYGVLTAVLTMGALLTAPWPASAGGVALYVVMWPAQLGLLLMGGQHLYFQLYLARRNLTSVEDAALSTTWSQAYYWKLDPPRMDRVTNVYDFGDERNVREFFGHGPELWRLLLWPLPTAAPGRGVEWARNPAHEERLQALKQEIDDAVSAGLQQSFGRPVPSLSGAAGASGPEEMGLLP